MPQHHHQLHHRYCNHHQSSSIVCRVFVADRLMKNVFNPSLMSACLPVSSQLAWLCFVAVQLYRERWNYKILFATLHCNALALQQVLLEAGNRQKLVFGLRQQRLPILVSSASPRPNACNTHIRWRTHTYAYYQQLNNQATNHPVMSANQPTSQSSIQATRLERVRFACNKYGDINKYKKTSTTTTRINVGRQWQCRGDVDDEDADDIVSVSVFFSFL